MSLFSKDLNYVREGFWKAVGAGLAASTLALCALVYQGITYRTGSSHVTDGYIGKGHDRGTYYDDGYDLGYYGSAPLNYGVYDSRPITRNNPGRSSP